MIRDLEAHPQPSYRIEVNGTLICHYRADFRYWDERRKERVVEDSKGVVTPDYRLKNRLMLAVHGVQVFESGRPARPRRKR